MTGDPLGHRYPDQLHLLGHLPYAPRLGSFYGDLAANGDGRGQRLPRRCRSRPKQGQMQYVVGAYTNSRRYVARHKDTKASSLPTCCNVLCMYYLGTRWQG
jgi:hypothetical protein